jgi:transcriptional regulator with XRE-family HTH domain
MADGPLRIVAASKEATTVETAFGPALREWRNRRRVSQLDLGSLSGVSAKHISFLETGRSKPSREMVHHLSEFLEVPLAERNALLHAAGFAPAYRSRDLSDAEMAQVLEAIDWTLERHEPFPALALDRHWNVVRANRPADVMIAAIGLPEGGSMLEAMANTQRMTAAVANWDEVARYLVVRLRTESAFVGGDPVLDAAADQLANEHGALRPHYMGVLPAVVPIQFRAGEMILSLFSTIAQFGTAEDIALADLRIEMYFPADEATRQVLIGLAAD